MAIFCHHFFWRNDNLGLFGALVRQLHWMCINFLESFWCLLKFQKIFGRVIQIIGNFLKGEAFLRKLPEVSLKYLAIHFHTISTLFCRGEGRDYVARIIPHTFHKHVEGTCEYSFFACRASFFLSKFC